MSAPDERRALAAIGCDLVARDGGPGDRRGAALLDRLAGAECGEVALDDLRAVPDWLRLPRPAQRRIAQRAALFSIAPALAGTIDGAQLRDHASMAGEDAVDWAIEQADAAPDSDLPAIAAEALDARGFALMRAALPEGLRPLIDVEPSGVPLPETVAQACVAAALHGMAAA